MKNKSAGEEQLEQYLKENFEWFHRHPELSYEEWETTAKIRTLLTEEGIEILPCPPDTGLAAVVHGTKGTPSGGERTIALRCDIDALPVVEETALSYRSETLGKMHACGHDFHIVAGIGAAILLKRKRERFAGTVKFIFQPGEEESHGALKILETDVMNDVGQIWGFHADPTNEVGVVGIREGYVAAAVDRFMIRVRGVGCHGAHPDDGVDSILVSAAIIQALQSIVSRNVNAFHPALVSVTRMQAGATWNVIPPEAEMEGTVRTMDREDRALCKRRIREIAERTAAAYGAEAEIVWTPGPPAVDNDTGMARLCEEVAEECGMITVPEESSLGGDDFSYYEDRDTVGRKLPGCYVKIGVGVGKQIHHPAFCVEESAILPAAQYLAALLERALL